MKFPTVHLNGTASDALVDQACVAAGALRSALDAMADAAPNGRDYYPQGDGALAEAQAEHLSRIEKVRSVLAEYEQMAEAIEEIASGRR